MAELLAATGPGIAGSVLLHPQLAQWTPDLQGLQSALDSSQGALTEASRASSAVHDGASWALSNGSTIALAALAIGLALWLVGDRIFRPAASLVGAAIGAFLGLAAAGIIQAGALGPVPMPYLTIGVGSLVGLAIGAAMYRVAVGGAGAIVLGVAGCAIVVLLTAQPIAGDAPPRPETMAEVAQDSARSTPWSPPETVSVREARQAALSIRDSALAQWATLPDRTRPLALAGAIAGCVVGFSAGLIRPRTIGPAAAALAGAALWLGATTVLLAQAGHATPPSPLAQPGGWLGAWIGVSLIGFVVQRRVVRPGTLAKAN